MLEITSIEKGIVIDHITAGYGIQVFNYLNLDKADYNVALICNAYSEKMGKKDIIKINNVIDINYDFLGLIDPNATVNIIEDGKTIKKVNIAVKVEPGRNVHVKGAKRRGDLLLIPFTKIEKVGEFIIVTE